MAAFLLREGLHRLVPLPVAATRLPQRETILGWPRAKEALSEVVQTYRFERRRGAYSHSAHAAAARTVEQIDRAVDDAMTYAGVCIEWAEREHRAWFWRCAPNDQVL